MEGELAILIKWPQEHSVSPPTRMFRPIKLEKTKHLPNEFQIAVETDQAL